MNSPLRIQMEGRLEQVERSTAALKDLASTLTQGNWPTAELLDEVTRDDDALAEPVAELQKRKAEAPLAVKTLAYLDAARAQARKALARKLRQLGWTQGTETVPALAGELRTHLPVVMEQRLRPPVWVGALLLALMGVMLVVAANVGAGKSAVTSACFALMFGVFVLLTYWRPQTVAVTQRALVVGRQAAPLDQLLSVNASIRGASLGGDLIITLRDRPAWHAMVNQDPAVLIQDPAVLIEALLARGVPVWKVKKPFYL